MGELMKRFLYEEDGMGTVEMVMIICVLVGLALLFQTTVRTRLGSIVDTILDKLTVQ